MKNLCGYKTNKLLQGQPANRSMGTYMYDLELIDHLREVGALPAYASGEGSGVEVTKDWKDLARRGLASLSSNS